MGVSNYLPSSRLIAPGVCTSSTRPASPFEGQAIFETDTDRMLIWNGTTWVVPNAPAQNPTGLEYITSAIATSGTSLSVNSCFTSTYSSYLLRTTGTVSSGAYGLDLKLRASGTDTSTGYYWAVTRVDLAAGTSYDKGNNSSIYGTGAITASTTGRCSSVIQVFDPQLAQYTSIMSQSTDSRGSSAYGGISGSGQLINTTQYDGFSLMFGGGSGTIGYLKVDVYGYRV